MVLSRRYFPQPQAHTYHARRSWQKKYFTGFLDQLVSLFSSLCAATPLPYSTDENYFRNERKSELDWGAQGVMEVNEERERDEVKIAFIFFPKSMCDSTAKLK